MRNVRLHRSGRYEARIKIQGKSWSAYGESEAEAVDNLDTKISQSTRHVDSQTLGSYWLTGYLPTIENHSQKWKEQIEWSRKQLTTLLDEPLTDISRAAVQGLLNAKSKNLSWWSLAHIRKVLYAVLNLAEADGLIPSNPVRHVKLPPKKSAVTPVLDAKALGSCMSPTRHTHTGAFPVVVLAGLLGLRLGEIQALRPEHFRKKGRLIVPGTKTEASYRELPLPERVRDLLGDRKFPLCPQSQSSAGKALKRIDPSLHAHLLRHSFNTGLQELGCPREVRERLMGHSSKGIQAVYSHGELWSIMSEWLERWVDEVLPAELGKSWVRTQEPKR